MPLILVEISDLAAVKVFQAAVYHGQTIDQVINELIETELYITYKLKQEQKLKAL